ncbi:Calponin -like protein OV9M [Trichinella pseudospiralis]|uniref:Calponin-like protein OV9M n=1 Tax=Trichinella pseudospiralis TaxID=6337 RepID=A0A0V1E6C3_TRIPS|nr:Calponin -like protein OV9M [Trichinella pseudospiralis]
MHPQQWPAWGRPGAVVFMLAVILFLLIPFAELVAQSRVTQARLRPPHLIDQQLDVTNTHKIRCYSCMSTFYESAWAFLSQAFNRPLNFTNECDFPTTQSRVGMVDCSSVCIKMWEDTTLLGIPFRGFIRGCYDSMLVQGFNQTIVRWYRWLHRDSCHFYNKQEVLQLPFRAAQQNGDRPDRPPDHLYICTCYSEGCNGSGRLSAADSHFNPPLLLPCCLLLFTIWNQLYTFFINACNSESCPDITNSSVLTFRYPVDNSGMQFKCIMIVKRSENFTNFEENDSLKAINSKCQSLLREGEPFIPFEWATLGESLLKELYDMMQEIQIQDQYSFHGGFRLTLDYYVAKPSRILLNWGSAHEFSFTLLYPIEIYKNGNPGKNRTASMQFSPLKDDPIEMSTIFHLNDYKTTVATSRTDKRPYCRSFILHPGSVTYGELQPCDNYDDWEYFVCESKPYKDCIVDFFPPCYQITNNQTECYETQLIIRQHPDLPYGKPCEEFPLKKCEQCLKCVNTEWSQWGFWSSDCDTATRQRWRTRDTIPQAVCKITPEHCCLESQEKIFEKQCETIYSRFVKSIPYSLPIIIAFSLGIILGWRQICKFEKKTGPSTAPRRPQIFTFTLCELSFNFPFNRPIMSDVENENAEIDGQEPIDESQEDHDVKGEEAEDEDQHRRRDHQAQPKPEREDDGAFGKPSRLPREKLMASEGIIPIQSGTNKYASQRGMTGFGVPRDVIDKVKAENLKPLEDEEKLQKLRDVLPLQSGTNKFASQKGMTGFGCPRDVLYKTKGTGGATDIPEDKAKATDGVIPLQAGTNKLASQSGMTGFGMPRSVLHRFNPDQDRNSQGFVHLQAGTNKLATQQGMTSFGSPRTNVTKYKDSQRGDLVNDESAMPKQTCGYKEGANQSGMTGFGMPRNTTLMQIGRQDQKSQGLIPYQMGINWADSQAGKTGFGMPRQIFTSFIDDSRGELPEEMARMPEVPFWSGMEKFASQTGMTAMGMPRDVKGSYLRRLW